MGQLSITNLSDISLKQTAKGRDLNDGIERPVLDTHKLSRSQAAAITTISRVFRIIFI